MMKALSISRSALPKPSADAKGYYSAEDEQRMQAMVRALLQGRRPIALSSPSGDALDHYSRLLVRDLRQHDHVKVVAHVAGSCDKLVQQVSDLLADLPLAHGVARDPAAMRPIHVFVVHDSPTLSSAEFALLVRLVNDLPGANLRIALIQDRDFAVTGNLQALGAQALHWRIPVAGMPASAGSQASREALREALRESPETLPPWARPADEQPARRRWRLAFWRRDPRAPAAPTRAATGHKAPARHAVKPLARSAAQVSAKVAANTLKPSAKSKPKSAGPFAGKQVAKNAGRSAAQVAVLAHNPVARRNRMVLVSGVLLSAALAGALGTWLSIQPGANRAAKPMHPTASTNAPSTQTATLALRARP